MSTEYRDKSIFFQPVSLSQGAYIHGAQSIMNYHTKSITAGGGEFLNIFSVTNQTPSYHLTGTSDFGTVRAVLQTLLVHLFKAPV